MDSLNSQIDRMDGLTKIVNEIMQQSTINDKEKTFRREVDPISGGGGSASANIMPFLHVVSSSDTQATNAGNEEFVAEENLDDGKLVLYITEKQLLQLLRQRAVIVPNKKRLLLDEKSDGKRVFLVDQSDGSVNKTLVWQAERNKTQQQQQQQSIINSTYSHYTIQQSAGRTSPYKHVDVFVKTNDSQTVPLPKILSQDNYKKTVVQFGGQEERQVRVEEDYQDAIRPSRITTEVRRTVVSPSELARLQQQQHNISDSYAATFGQFQDSTHQVFDSHQVSNKQVVSEFTPGRSESIQNVKQYQDSTSYQNQQGLNLHESNQGARIVATGPTANQNQIVSDYTHGFQSTDSRTVASGQNFNQTQVVSDYGTQGVYLTDAKQVASAPATLYSNQDLSNIYESNQTVRRQENQSVPEYTQLTYSNDGSKPTSSDSYQASYFSESTNAFKGQDGSGIQFTEPSQLSVIKSSTIDSFDHLNNSYQFNSSQPTVESSNVAKSSGDYYSQYLYTPTSEPQVTSASTSSSYQSIPIRDGGQIDVTVTKQQAGDDYSTTYQTQQYQPAAAQLVDYYPSISKAQDTYLSQHGDDTSSNVFFKQGNLNY
jgi:hypothetical protein